MASVSSQAPSALAPTSSPSSLLMMQAIRSRKGRRVPAASKYRACVEAHSSAPPHEARINASAICPFFRQHWTAASKFPTSSARLIISSARASSAGSRGGAQMSSPAAAWLRGGGGGTPAAAAAAPPSRDTPARPAARLPAAPSSPFAGVGGSGSAAASPEDSGAPSAAGGAGAVPKGSSPTPPPPPPPPKSSWAEAPWAGAGAPGAACCERGAESTPAAGSCTYLSASPAIRSGLKPRWVSSCSRAFFSKITCMNCQTFFSYGSWAPSIFWTQYARKSLLAMASSNRLEAATSSRFSTTRRTCSFRLPSAPGAPKLSSLPPKPKEAPAGRAIHRGARPLLFAAEPMEKTCTFRSKLHAETSVGTCGDQASSYRRPEAPPMVPKTEAGGAPAAAAAPPSCVAGSS
mmetsp:Transcript_27630/g.45683  ORF Transcript_27630/g.45683 Transcript_27630/m.45683 type:complete len:405 (+) Transcript_27630:630-1844(+)